MLKNCYISSNNTNGFYIQENSHPVLSDSYFDVNKINIIDTSNITLYRSANIWVGNSTNGGLDDVNVTITDQWGIEIYNGSTNLYGEIPLQTILGYVHDSNGGNQTNVTLKVAKAPLGTTEINRTILPQKNEILWRTYIANDSDDDGLNDGEEKYLYFTNPNNNDTDRDGLLDGLEFGLSFPHHNSTNMTRFKADHNVSSSTRATHWDSDDDGLMDGLEDANQNGEIDSNETNPNNPDSDGDGIYDGYEVDWNIDTDGDGLINALDNDSDNDGLPDGTEDADCDGYLDIGELSPVLLDTDYDGTNDYGMNQLLELKLTAVFGMENYILSVNDVTHPNNGSYSNVSGLNEVLAVGLILENVTIILRNETGVPIGGFRVNASSEGEFDLSYENATLYFKVSKFNFWTNVSGALGNDTDNDGLNDLLEIIYMSGRCANFTVEDIDEDGENAMNDTDCDGDGLSDYSEYRSMLGIRDTSTPSQK